MTASAPGRRLRVLFYAQHLSGVGHYVRTLEIARALAVRHDAWVVDGGRAVPRRDIDAITLLPVPRISRGQKGLVSLDGDLELTEALRRRSVALRETVESLHPDVLVVEHYPFSKWELEDEIRGVIGVARRARPDVRVVCSVRDVLPQTRHEDCPADAYAARVIDRLHAHFDGLMVHGDPSLTRLDEHFAAASAIRLPVAHTGIVAEPLTRSADAARSIGEVTGGEPFVLASAGGGTDPQDLLGTCLQAWHRLQDAGAMRGWRLVVFGGLGWSADARDALARRAATPSVVVRPFDSDFLHWVHAARLSISCAGYNTCANVLQARCRAVLVPNPAMSDQLFRARALRARGIAEVVEPGTLSAERLAEAVRNRLAAPLPDHAIALDGAARSRAFMERLAGWAASAS
jgi:predicted glycosyltransferase